MDDLETLPRWLLAPMFAQLLTSKEAHEIYWVWEQAKAGETKPLPQHLWQAAQRLHLYELDPVSRLVH